MSAAPFPYPAERPLISRVLRNAKTLIMARGWTAEGPSINPAPDTPLTLTGALWEGARWGEGGKFVAPDAAGKAARALCVILWGERAKEDDLSFVALGRWARVEGRTQDDVLRLLDRSAAVAVRAIQQFVAELEAASGGDIACAECAAPVNPLRDTCPQCGSAMERLSAQEAP